MRWFDARHVCRENYTDLATFENMDDINSLEPTFSYELAWIGLWDEPRSWKSAMGIESNSWRWSATNETSKTGYSNWWTNEPQNAGGSQACVAMSTDGKWVDDNCETDYYFICYTVSNENERTYALIRDLKPWDSALEYCRAHHTDMAMIENIEQDNEVNAAKSDAGIVWIGLYRVPWVWSDKSQSSFTHWHVHQPNNYLNKQFCVAVNEQHKWNDDYCENERPFICHQVSRLRRVVRVKFRTDADISDPAISTQILQKFLPRKYYYIDKKMNWTDARHVCRENYTDLATFENMDDINSQTFSYEWAWIGLWDDPRSWKSAMGIESNSWRWSATNETSKTGYSNWMKNEPQNAGGSEACVAMSTDGTWKDQNCESSYYFICYTVSNENKKTYALIRHMISWDSALEYCRAHHTDMAMIENIEQNNEVNAAKSDAGIVWIGLYRVPWVWSDKSQSSFKNWRSGKPNNYDAIQFCGGENEQHEWDDDDCTIEHPFICHQVSRLRRVVRVKFRTDADISDPAISTQILQKPEMDRNVTLIVFFFGFCMFSSVLAARLFHYVNLTKTWDDARLYCREKYTDLATIRNKEQLGRLERPENMNTSAVWIGLRDNPEHWQDIMHNKSNAWRWSTNGATGQTAFENWHPGEPDNKNAEYCVFMDSQGMWFDGDCENLRSFVCFNESLEGEKTFVFVSTLKSWKDSRRYCRFHHAELARIENELENTNITLATPDNATVWIGMYRVPGAWSDGDWSLFRNWKNGQPDVGTERCVTEQPSHMWQTTNCNNSYTFLCHEDTPLRKVVVKMKIRTDADMTDPANSNNLFEQLADELTSHGLTYFKLQWKIHPRKVKQPTVHGCDMHRVHSARCGSD
ncbi:Macrophage mannose receptor 1 [Collichthys lucidus]|uniref:Macrophage mannose receptor 1 n=1 Tax=Collichthys lucidus TaxID=240159 RepID=A0A4U5V443_COLLU|nr:Macrophage mannose receptor 1 [Collichthys lucidus]